MLPADTDHVADLTDTAMQTAVDAHLVRRVRVALQPWQTLIGQRRRQRPGRIIEACGAAEVEHAQLLNACLALLADQLAAALHIDAHFDLKIRRIDQAQRAPPAGP